MRLTNNGQIPFYCIFFSNIDKKLTIISQYNPHLCIHYKYPTHLSLVKNDKNVSAQTKIENIKELIIAMEDYNSIEEFLEHVSLVTAIDENNEDNKVSIMTLHAAKGLEFPLIFITTSKLVYSMFSTNSIYFISVCFLVKICNTFEIIVFWISPCWSTFKVPVVCWIIICDYKC